MGRKMILKIELEIPSHWTDGDLEDIIADLSSGEHVTLTPGSSGVIADASYVKTGLWQVTELPDAPGGNMFIVTRGLPQAFTGLDDAGQWASEQCEQDHQDRTVMLVPAKALDHALVARYLGVRLHSLAEAREAP